MTDLYFTELSPFRELTLINANYYLNLHQSWTSIPCKFKVLDLALSLTFFDGVVNSTEMVLVIAELIYGKIYYDDSVYFVDVNSHEIGLKRVILSINTTLILNKTIFNVCDLKTVELIEKTLEDELRPYLQQYCCDLEIKQNNLSALMQIAQDFYATQLSGPLREWMNGTLKARTLRIESVARHKFECVERLAFSQTKFRRPRNVLTDLYIRDVLKDAVENASYGGSTQLRIQKIIDKINLGMDQFISLADVIIAKFVLNLCEEPSIKSPGTIRNHYQNGRHFIQFSVGDVGTYEEFCAQDFITLVQQYFQLNEESQETIVAINYLFKLLDINVRIGNSKDDIKGIKKSNLPYADCMSENEIGKICQLLNDSALTASQKKDALFMVILMTKVPLRREDVATLRLKDLVSSQSPHIVFSSATTGKKKSKNANRVVDDYALELGEIFKYAEAKKMAFDDHRAGLFSRLDNPKSFENGYDVLSIIGCAIRAATGAKDLSPHNFRTGIISNTLRNLLSVEISQQSTSDSLRLAVFEAFVLSGHGDFRTTVEHYACFFEWIRREWIDHITAEHLEVSPQFLSSISGLNSETLRKYANDHHKLSNYLAKVLTGLTLAFEDRVILIKDFLNKEIQYYPFDDKNTSVEDTQLVKICYQALILAGLDVNVTADLLNVTCSEQEQLSKNFQLLSLAARASWTTDLPIKQILNLGHFQALVTRLGEVHLDATQIIGISQIFKSDIGDAWQLEIKDFDLFPDDFFTRIERSGFETIFSYSNNANQTEVDQIVQRLLPKHKEQIALRNFSKNKSTQIRFVFRGDEKNTWPRRCREATKWVTLFLISFFTTKIRE